ncbi:MAG: amidohydrolase family protein [Planctomycetaceae bacterium]
MYRPAVARTSQIRFNRFSLLRPALLSVLIAGFCTTSRADRSSEQVEGLHSNIPAIWAITQARVVVNPEVVIDHATVVIRDGKIESVVSGGPIPSDARVIDGAGRTIYPGFIDAYSEQSVSADALMKTARYWNNNIVPQLSVAGQVEEVTAAASLRKQGVVARLVAPSDGIIRGRSAIVSLNSGDVNRRLIATNVAQHLQLTISRRSRNGYPNSPMGAVALARQAMYDAQWYRDAWIAANADPALPRPEVNDALAALEPAINGTMPVIIETTDELFFQRADLFAAEFGLKLVVRGSGREYRRLDDVRATGRPVILPVAFPSAPNVESVEAAQDVSLESLMHWDLAPENPARVDQAGITFAFSTDQLSSSNDFLKSIRQAVKRGLSPVSALRALTTTPAEMFGVSDQLGTVQKGRLASLTVTDGDIFDEKTKVVETWVAGERFPFATEPETKIDGQYEIALGRSDQMPEKVFIQLKQDGNRVKAKVSRKEIVEESKTSQPSEADKQPSEADKNVAAQESKEPEDSDPDGKTSEKSSDKSGKDKSASDVLTLANVSFTDSILTGTFDAKDWQIEGVTRLTLVVTGNGEGKKQPAALGSLAWPNGSQVTATARLVEPKSESAGAEKDGENGSSEKESGDSKSDEQKKSDESAAFAVNFPLGAFGRPGIPDQPKLAAFVHATIWTCGPAGMIEDGTLLVSGGKIVAVGQSLEIPENAEIYDVRGMHISPGMIDCHSHAATDGGVNESAQAITCEVRIGDFIDSDDITIYRQLAGGVTAANILHGSANPIGGQNQVIKLRWGMNGEQMKFAEAPKGVKFALGENVKQSNWSEPTGRYPQTRMGVEQIYRDAFRATRDYAARMDAWQKERRGLPPRRNLELDALREIIEGKRWIHCHSYRQDEILALIRILDEYKITIGTFQHILEGYKVADAMARHGAMASAFSDWWAYKMEVQDAIPYAGALMHSAGVVVSFNSDDGELARHLNQEAAKAVKYGGVSREEALKFVTLNPARQLRIDQYVGSLEPGKHADFVVWNADPLSNFSRCEQTWIDGRPFFHRREDEQLRDAAHEMRTTLIQKILKSGNKMRSGEEKGSDPSDLWPRFDEFCQHIDYSKRVRLLDEQAGE